MSQLSKSVYISVNGQSWTCGVLVTVGAPADFEHLFCMVTCVEMNEQKPKLLGRK